MFLSKIWFFLVALAATIALTIALVMPRPAQRQHIEDEHNRLALACGVVNVALTDDARNRIELASSFARAQEVVNALESAGNADKLDEARMKLDENDFGDYAAGRPLVDDALNGYLRDDIWAQNGTMYFVAAAPAIKR